MAYSLYLLWCLVSGFFVGVFLMGPAAEKKEWGLVVSYPLGIFLFNLFVSFLF